MSHPVKRAAVVGAALAAVFTMSPNAQALDGDHHNLYSPSACDDHWRSAFSFHIFFNSNLKGSYRNIGYSVYDFGSLKAGAGDPNHYPLRFCQMGASAPWPGSNQKIKNNAASARNDHYKYIGRVYYRSGYKGAQDVLSPNETIGKFSKVYNENASFKWTSS
ncbi:hypothetical protein ACFYN9_38325 [Streptomyces collinus]|uniref:Secreted protein n=2 Tax=Streptomyces TaxID=1883 RepID=A0AA89QKA0_STRCU|nr:MULTISPECIES: hypothetical protein [Streptomyces]MBB5813974.1 hypothetical protein [Streptomyces collinus]MEC7056832.1 hypothetical protein [Streptomyces violaceochromogenes]WMX67027.1 hypothetical protein RFN52_28155 [Streptomyces collinus]GHC88822.1 hypothetical protein GCM10010309_69630 [Streptomyces violaceochromogenes]